MTDDTIARLTRERDEAMERASSLSRELLDAMQARDRYRETAAYAESRAARLEAALGLIAGVACKTGYEETGDYRTCAEAIPTGRAFWCPSCIARAALAPPHAAEGKETANG